MSWSLLANPNHDGVWNIVFLPVVSLIHYYACFFIVSQKVFIAICDEFAIHIVTLLVVLKLICCLADDLLEFQLRLKSA